MNNWIGNINGNNGIITQGQIGNNTINFGKQPRNLDAPQMQGLKNAILTELPRDKAFSIGTVMGDQEAISLAMQVHSFMKSQGFQVGDGVFQGVFSGPVVGYVRNDKPDGGVEIIIGANPH